MKEPCQCMAICLHYNLFLFADLRPEPAIVTTRSKSFIACACITCHQQQFHPHRWGN
jgi:hypothetical protein